MSLSRSCKQNQQHLMDTAIRVLVLAVLVFASLNVAVADSKSEVAPRFAEGVKIGEVTAVSAVLWTRLCAVDGCDESFHLPGVDGEVRVRYRSTGQPWSSTSWQVVSGEEDYTCQMLLNGLIPGSKCEYIVEARNAQGDSSFKGSFRTAPAAGAQQAVRFVVTTGHKHATSDNPESGPNIYPAMAELEPHFFVHTGDVVYYDNDAPPAAKSTAVARLHWHRLYSLPRRVDFHRSVPSYFMKDDHALLKNDCWPGQTYGELTFDEGVRLFNEQTPSGSLPYRTFRWGKHLQIWLVEGREYRSPNTVPDGPDKTIWGTKQMQWLQEDMVRSNATFRVLISPTPIVGPDRRNKHDNHCNKDFEREGNLIRGFLSELPNTYVVCGDRHWQYVSVDPKTGLREYSCGPSTDKHSGGWRQNDVRPEHRFLRVAGGFLSVEVSEGEKPAIEFKLHDVKGDAVYSETQTID